jgi:hypothetical protein
MDSNVKKVENLNLEQEKKLDEIVKKYPKYLPLGSIVMLKNGWKKIMIIGYSPIDMNKENKVYDYMACLYPEGVINTNYNILFNHEDIKQIFALGLRDEEQQNFMLKLPDLIKNAKK